MKRLLCSVMLFVTGCSSGSVICAGNGTTPITITVIDGANGEYVCDARVTASDGSSTYASFFFGTSDASLTDASCSYWIDPHKSGTYSVSASAPGLHTTGATPSFTLTYDQCGYEGNDNYATITMSP
jgi:hypothetical protein